MSAPEQENNWENDPVWDLLDEAKAPGAGPLFVRNVMREVRLSDEIRPPWWRQLLTPRPILAGSLAALTAAILIWGVPKETAQIATKDPRTEEATEPQALQLDALLEEEMLSQAAEDPTAFSDEALVALLYH
ncbi:MAG: hypothetical protein QF405_09395 [Roseibacillus sp.]|jgi:hypothetical protein|nr:hypothetical protein [Roseibacillus sp.]MDP7307840.1 hypothetical protein [Roseibacillus sp.]MDP7655051.1 hypothetical protein [Roseibacillus sp.]